MFLPRIITALLSLLLISIICSSPTSTSAHTITRLKERAESPTLDVLECKVASDDSFNEGKGATRHQLIAVGATNPNGAIQTYQNSEIPEYLTFRLAISALSTEGIDLTLINTKSGYTNAPPNSLSQVGRYRINLFDKEGKAHMTSLWLGGYEKCRYTIRKPVNIDGFFVMNVVVLNTIR